MTNTERALRDLKAVATNLGMEATLLKPSRAKVAERLRNLVATMDAAIKKLEQEETA